jgi:MFS family permease
MRAGIIVLVVAYVLSQFYRAFLAVLTPVLASDLGATAGEMSRASGLWFLVFAAMQVPVGWALDRVGPRRLAASLLALGGGGGALIFALATTPAHVQAAMVLIGIGCSPVLMASYFIFARLYSPRVFATLAGAVIGFGSLGNIAGSLPMAWAIEAFGWRETMAGLATVTAAISVVIWLTVKDPPRLLSGDGGHKGSVLELLKMPALWAVLPLVFVNYAPSMGIRGLWAGPYLEQVHRLDPTGIGWATLVMGLAMVIGNFAYGPLDRIFGTRKWVAFTGNALGMACLVALALMPHGSLATATLLLAALGLFGASYPLLMAHARSFFPAHLAGRGVTLVNLFAIGGVGLFQFASANVFAAAQSGAATSVQPFQSLFLFFAIPWALGCLIYLFSRDRLD